jgi:hypothetical protein
MVISHEEELCQWTNCFISIPLRFHFSRSILYSIHIHERKNVLVDVLDQKKNQQAPKKKSQTCRA